MKKLALLITIPFFATPLLAQADNHQSCSERRSDVESQLSYAKKYKNTAQTDRLEAALEDIKNNCAESANQARLDDVRDKQRRLERKQRELQDAQAELEEAKEQANQ